MQFLYDICPVNHFLDICLNRRHKGGLNNNYMAVELLRLGQNIWWRAETFLFLLVNLCHWQHVYTDYETELPAPVPGEGQWPLEPKRWFQSLLNTCLWKALLIAILMAKNYRQLHPGYHGIMKLFVLKGIIKGHLVQIPGNEQGHL